MGRLYVGANILRNRGVSMTLEQVRKRGAELGLFTIVDIAKHLKTNRSQIYVAIKTPEIEPSVHAKLCKFLELSIEKK